MSKGEDLNFFGGSDDYSLGAKGIAALVGKFQERITAEVEALNPAPIDSGRMLSDENFTTKISESGDLTIIDFFMVYYADYINQGVQGVDSNKNAPNSPYKYDHYGIAIEGRKSILASIERGKIKISDTTKTKYGKVGLEAKGKDTPNQQEINEREANKIAFLISKFGIKERGFINKAFEKFKKDVEENFKVIATKNIIYNLTRRELQ